MVRGSMGWLAVLGLLAVVPVGPAAAEPEYGPNDTKCRGRLLDADFIVANGTKIAEVQLYYSAPERLYCAVTVHVGPTAGKRIDTGITMFKGTSRTAQFQQASYQRGQYSQVAGPIGARGNCMYAWGGIDWNGKRHFETTSIWCVGN